MTSPYLNRPLRSLDDALKQRGVEQADIGFESNSEDLIQAHVKDRNWKIFGAFFMLAILATILAVGLHAALGGNGAPIAAEEPLERSLDEIAEKLNKEISTAAGRQN